MAAPGLATVIKFALCPLSNVLKCADYGSCTFSSTFTSKWTQQLKTMLFPIIKMEYDSIFSLTKLQRHSV